MLSQAHNGVLAVAYAYDQGGNNTQLAYPDGWAVDFTYDALSRVTAANDNNATPRVLASVSYDRLSRRQSVAYENGASAAYGYTPRGDLITHGLNFAGTANANYAFTYNGVGQLLSETVSDLTLEWLPAMDSIDNYTANGLNQYSDVDGVAPVYDGNGNTTTDHRGQTYTYDAENVLRSASGLASGTASYSYWADGARRQKSYDGVASVFYYAGDQEIAEYSGATLTRRYVRLPGSVDEPLLMIDYTLDTACTNTSYATCEVWAHQNRLGSVVATTDSSGAVIEKYTYSSYGVSDDATGFPFRFTGQKLDAETGLYYYKARYYDPEVGRFLQSDPIGYEDQMNLYAYVGNDPVNFYDPTGLCIASRISSCAEQATSRLDRIKITDPTTGEDTTIGALIDEVGSKLAGNAWKRLRDGVREALNNFRTFVTGMSGSVVGVVGVTGSAGNFVDTETGERGQFETTGGSVGLEGGGDLFVGGITGSADELGGLFSQASVTTPALLSFAYVRGIDGAGWRRSGTGSVMLDPWVDFNGVQGVTIGGGLGVGVSVGITNTVLYCNTRGRRVLRKTGERC